LGKNSLISQKKEASRISEEGVTAKADKKETPEN
jgi:hypothetical protein